MEIYTHCIKAQLEMFKILYLHGFDINEHIEWCYSEHRNLQNKVVTDYLLIGTELKKEWWLNSGHASKQAIAESKGDGSLLREMRGMSGSGIISAEGMYDSKDYNDGDDYQDVMGKVGE